MTEQIVRSEEWPRVPCEWDAARATEDTVRTVLKQMTLPEKIGQMIQPELYQITPEEVRDFRFGSVLNGAGLFPNGNRHADASEWLATVDAFWRASEEAFSDRPFRIPFMWATDAVHGHNNVFGATIYPHNIGLGCADDTALLRDIGIATAREVAATGIDWTFSPNVTVPRDYRWGRHFEGYSEDPALVARYARAMVSGLQGDIFGSDGAPGGVIACMKHWLADGGTRLGIDRGDCFDDVATLRDVHSAGFRAGIAAGGQTVMVSFSGWRHPANYDHSPNLPGSYNGKLSGSRYLITDVLKDRIGFDGLVITDWDAHADVARCSFGDAAFVINAGVDMLMVSPRKAWRDLYETTHRQVESGEIPVSRIDDAVSRILRVKTRAGLWEKPRPMERSTAKRTQVVGCEEHRALAHRAARQSAVLLKNNARTLPLPRSARVLVTGSAALDLRKQTGGWTLSWQGDDLVPGDLPGASTLGEAITAIVGGDRCVVDPRLERADPATFDAVIVALGEDAYAEMRGNIRPWRSLGYKELKTSYAVDCEILERLARFRTKQGGPKVVTLFFGGRPLYLTDEINRSDAFVAAWLPGPYNNALAGLLFADADGTHRHDFSGKLSFSWPRRRRSFVLNHPSAGGDGDYDPLFPIGYGLDYRDAREDLPQLPADDPAPGDTVAPAGQGIDILRGGGMSDLDWMICGHNVWSGQTVDFQTDIDLLAMKVQPQPRERGLSVRFNGYPALLYAQFRDRLPRDFRRFVAADARFEISLKLITAPDGPLMFAVHDDYPGQPALDIAPRLARKDGWQKIVVSASELAGVAMELDNVDTPFMLYSEARAELVLGDVRLVLVDGMSHGSAQPPSGGSS